MIAAPPPPVPAAYAAPFKTTGTPAARLHGHLYRHRHRHHHHAHYTPEIDSREPLFYSISTGEFWYKNQLVQDKLQSGHGKALNNPAFEHMKFMGPPPEKTYDISKPTSDPAINSQGKIITGLGINRLRLTAENNEDTGRDFIEIHSRQGRNNGSHGCITTQDQAHQDKLVAFIHKYRIKSIKVVSSYTPYIPTPNVTVATAEPVTTPPSSSDISTSAEPQAGSTPAFISTPITTRRFGEMLTP